MAFYIFVHFFFQDLSENHPGESPLDKNYYCYYFLSTRGAPPLLLRKDDVINVNIFVFFRLFQS